MYVERGGWGLFDVLVVGVVAQVYLVCSVQLQKCVGKNILQVEVDCWVFFSALPSEARQYMEHYTCVISKRQPPRLRNETNAEVPKPTVPRMATRGWFQNDRWEGAAIGGWPLAV